MKIGPNGKIKSMSVKKFYQSYAKQEGQRQKSVLTKKIVQGNTYFMMYTEKLINFFREQCQLVLGNEGDESWFIGYAMNTEGFPLLDNVPPQLSDRIYLPSIEIIGVDQSEMIIEKTNKSVLKFKIKNVQMIIQWITSIYKLRQAMIQRGTSKVQKKLIIKVSYNSSIKRSFDDINAFLQSQKGKSLDEMKMWKYILSSEVEHHLEGEKSCQAYQNLKEQLNATKELLNLSQTQCKGLSARLKNEEETKAAVLHKIYQEAEKSFQYLKTKIKEVEKGETKNKNTILLQKSQNESKILVKTVDMESESKRFSRKEGGKNVCCQKHQEKVKQLERQIEKINRINEDLKKGKQQIINFDNSVRQQLKSEIKKLEEENLCFKERQQTIAAYEHEISSLKSVIKEVGEDSKKKAEENYKINEEHVHKIRLLEDQYQKISKESSQQIQKLKKLNEDKDKLIIEKSQENIKLSSNEATLKKKLSEFKQVESNQSQMTQFRISLQEDLVKKNQKLNNVQGQLIELQNKNEEKERAIEKKKEEMNQISKQFTTEKNKLQLDVKILQKQNCDEKDKNFKLLNQLHLFEQKQEELKEKLSKKVELESQLEEVELQKKKISDQFNQTKEENQRILNKLEEEKRVLNSELIKYKREKAEAEQKQKRSQESILQLTSHRQSLQKKKLKVDQELKESLKEVKKLKHKICQTQREKGEVQEKLRESVKLFEQINQSMSSLQRQKLDLEERFRQYSEKAEKQMVQLEDRIKNDNSKLLFHGQLLEFHQDYKLFIRDSVQNLRKKAVTRTVQIFASDLLNPTSYHKYIDDVPNIVLIVKTESGVYFGGYSQSPMNKEKVANKSGMLMSLTNKKVYPLMEGKRSITYDNYFLIFGNSEIRIKQGELKVFSNFAIANGFFNPMGNTIDNLLSAGKERELLFSRFEIHRVFFEEEKDQ